MSLKVIIDEELLPGEYLRKQFFILLNIQPACQLEFLDRQETGYQL